MEEKNLYEQRTSQFEFLQEQYRINNYKMHELLVKETKRLHLNKKEIVDASLLKNLRNVDISLIDTNSNE